MREFYYNISLTISRIFLMMLQHLNLQILKKTIIIVKGKAPQFTLDVTGDVWKVLVPSQDIISFDEKVSSSAIKRNEKGPVHDSN